VFAYEDAILFNQPRNEIFAKLPTDFGKRKQNSVSAHI